MADLIERQAAIDAVYKCTDIFINNLPVMVDKADAYKALAELPSARPDGSACWGCNCPKMEQKTFSEMVRLHDAERRTDG